MSGQTGQIDALGIIVTSNCNLECAYCYQGGRPGNKAQWPDLRPALDWGLAHCGGHLEITLSGGEPLLAPHLVLKIINHAKRHAAPGMALSFRLLTNGLLLNEEIFRVLAAHKVEIRVSCDGLPAAQNRRGEQTFQTLDEVFERLFATNAAACREHLLAVMTVTPDNLPQLASGVEYLLKKGFSRIEAAPVLTPCQGWLEPDLPMMRSQFDQLEKISRRHRSRTGDVPLMLLRRWANLPPQQPRNGPACSAALVHRPAIDCDGRLYSCGLFARSVTTPASDSATVSAALEWGRPDTAGFAKRRGQHADQLASFPVFGDSPRYGLFGDCSTCEHRSRCFVCPLALLPDQPRQQVPGFVCAFHAIAHETWRRFPPLPAPATACCQPEILAQQNAAFRQATAKIMAGKHPPS